MDKTRQARLLRSVQRHTRTGHAILSMDRLSRAFLCCPPRHPHKLTPEEWSEAFCRFMCAPSPACAPVVGQTLVASRLGGPIDAHGDIMLNANINGYGLVTKLRHDPFNQALAQALKQSGSFVQTEVSGWLASSIPPANLALLDADPNADPRRRLITPDIIAQVGPRAREQYIETKTTSYNATYYRPDQDPKSANFGVALRATNARRDLLAHARALDRRLNLVPPVAQGAGIPPPGPCERRIRAVSPITAVVVGGFCEGSSDLHALVTDIAAASADKMQNELGMEYHPAKARVTEYLYRDLGVIAARGVARMILDRRQCSLPWQLATRRGAGLIGTAGAIAARLYHAVESIGLEQRAGRGSALVVATGSG